MGKFNCFTHKDFLIKILVDEVRNKVLFVQAGKNFVDVLISFLTLPLGTIARLLHRNAKDVSIGSLSSLYESVTYLEVQNFVSAFDKELLVNPINSMGDYCRHLKLNIDNTEDPSLFNFRCSDRKCLGKQRDKLCKCRINMRSELCKLALPPKKGFVPGTATFTISDDLSVKADNSQSNVSLPKYLGCEGIDTIKIITMEVTRRDILELVKCSFLSATPLTDVFLSKSLYLEYPKPSSVLDIDDDIVKFRAKLTRGIINIKAMVRKSNDKILFALGEEDFADMLLSFLTIPLGGVEYMLRGKSDIDGIDNLYNSMLILPSRYLRSKDLLIKQREQHKYGGKQITKSPATYMVTDDLVITPGSSTSAISFLTEMKIPPSDLEERLISIGNKEALSLLKASLISSSALTNGLGPFLNNTKDSEKTSN